MKAGAGRPNGRGAALVLALVVTALAAGLAGSMLFYGELQIGRTTQVVRQLQAWQLAAGMEDWAFSILDRDRELSPHWDSAADSWSRPLPPTPVPGGQVAGEIQDLSGRFNLNSLLRPDGTGNALAIRRFRRLVVEVLGLDPAIPDQLLDYMRTHSAGVPAAGGAGFILHESELAALAAMSESALQRIGPLVAALPPRSGINVNTAPAEVLMALAPGIPASLAAQWSSERTRPWESVLEFAAADMPAGIAVNPEGLTVRSSAFLAHARISLGDGVFDFYSVILLGGTAADSSYHVRNRSMSAP